jgi:hypothetical protein
MPTHLSSITFLRKLLFIAIAKFCISLRLLFTVVFHIYELSFGISVICSLSKLRFWWIHGYVLFTGAPSYFDEGGIRLDYVEIMIVR